MSEIHESKVQRGTLQQSETNMSREKNMQQKRQLSKGQKWLIGVVCAIGTFALGGVIGYGVIGKGEPVDALKPSTWKHIYDLVYKDVK